MPPKRPSKPHYSQYLVDVDQRSRSATIYLDGDSYTRENHATATPPIIPVLPPAMIPNVPPQPPQATTHSSSVSRENENSQSQLGESLIESFEEPTPEDEVDWIENVSQFEIYFQKRLD